MGALHFATVALVVSFALAGIVVAVAVAGARRRFDAAPTQIIDVAPTRLPGADETPIDKLREPQAAITVVRVAIPMTGTAKPTDAGPAATRPTSSVTPDAHEATFLRELEAAEYYEEPRQPIVRAYTDYIVARVRREADAASPAADIALCAWHADAAGPDAEAN